MHFVHESESQVFDSIALIQYIFRGERAFVGKLKISPHFNTIYGV